MDGYSGNQLKRSSPFASPALSTSVPEGAPSVLHLQAGSGVAVPTPASLN